MKTKTLSNKKSFLFDFDGTLIDSSGAHESAFLKAMQKNDPILQNNFSYEHWKGYRTESVFRSLGVTDETLVQSLTADKQAFYRHQVDIGAVQLMPGAIELLDYLARMERRLFIVTSASRRSLDTAVTHLKIGKYFECTVSGDDVERAKPAPACYIKCLELSNSSLVDSLAIEDAAAGVESAQAAGLDVAIVNNESLSELEHFFGSLKLLHQHLSTTEN